LTGYEGLDANSDDVREDLIFEVNRNGSLTPFHRRRINNPITNAKVKVEVEQEVPDRKGLTACVIGIPTAHTILPALFTQGITQVIVYSSVFDEVKEEEGMDNDESSSNTFKQQQQKQQQQQQQQQRCFTSDIRIEIQLLRLESLSHMSLWNYFYAKEVATELDKRIEYRPISDILTAINFNDQNNADADADADVDVDRDSDSYDHEVLPHCHVIQLNPDHICEPVLTNHSVDLFSQSL
jgi:hypothetical protein